MTLPFLLLLKSETPAYLQCQHFRMSSCAFYVLIRGKLKKKIDPDKTVYQKVHIGG